MRRLPFLPTIIVALAVTVMIGLGLWQIRRAHDKEAVLARLSAAQNQPAIAYPALPLPEDAMPLFRKAQGTCARVAGLRTAAGTNRADETGFLFIADCAGVPRGMSVELGWSKNPNARPNWTGGPVEGIIAPDSKTGMRLVSVTGLGGLETSAPPSIESIPNNHRSYAVQWFLFAGIALLIYGLAVRNKLKPKS